MTPNACTDPPRSPGLAMSCAVDPIVRGPIEKTRPRPHPQWQLCSVLIDGPKPKRLLVAEIRNPFDVKPTQAQNPLQAS